MNKKFKFVLSLGVIIAIAAFNMISVDTLSKVNNNIPKSISKIYSYNFGSNEVTTEGFLNFHKEVLYLVNVERDKQGLNLLILNDSLSNVATKKSQDMIDKNYFDHNSPTYGSPFDMMKQFDITYIAAGENIAMGQKTSKEVVNDWMNSEGHRANILNDNFTEMGIGITQNSNGTLYWTQIFIGR